MLHLPLGQTMRKLIPFHWDTPIQILDVTAGKKLIWRNWLGGFNNGETLDMWVVDGLGLRTGELLKGSKGYEVTFMDIMPQAKDVIQGHAWALPFQDNSFDVIVCDYPFTPSLMDDRLNDSRVRAKYNHTDGARLYYQNQEVGGLVVDDSKIEKYVLLREHNKKKSGTWINQNVGDLEPDTSKKYDVPNIRMRDETNLLKKKMQTKAQRADLYMGTAIDRRTRREEPKGQADRVSTDPIKRFKHANLTTGSHLSNSFARNPMDRFSKSRHTVFTERWTHYRMQSSRILSNGFVPPLMNFENSWEEFNRVARKGLVIKIGEYHKDYEYFPGDMEAFACFDRRANPESKFIATGRAFYKGVRPMVHQVPHMQPVVTFYEIFKRDPRER